MKDLNCDLGEGEPSARTRALMALVTSANIACGGHAGDEASMRRCLALCRKFGVRAGAHPAFADRKNFGRRALPLSEDDLTLLLLQQVGALAWVASVEQVRPHHVKLHGALYHVVEADRGLSKSYVRTMAEYFPGWKIYASPFGHVVAAARQAGVPVWREAFADRAYLSSGALAPRGEPGAVISAPSAVRERVRELRLSRRVRTVDGTRLPIEAETLCVHGDSPGAVRMARVLSAELPQNMDRRRG
jgi:UPF0271 protein